MRHDRHHLWCTRRHGAELRTHRTIQESKTVVNTYRDARCVAHIAESVADWLWWRERFVRVRAGKAPARGTLPMDDPHDQGDALGGGGRGTDLHTFAKDASGQGPSSGIAKSRISAGKRHSGA